MYEKVIFFIGLLIAVGGAVFSLVGPELGDGEGAALAASSLKQTGTFLMVGAIGFRIFSK